MKEIIIILYVTCGVANAFSQTQHTEIITPQTTKHFTGTINGKYNVEMTLTVDDKSASGSYRYFSQKASLFLEGTHKSNGEMFLHEKTNDGKTTGYFEGVWNGSVYNGTWLNADRTKSFPFALTTKDKDLNLDFTVRFSVADDDFVSLIDITINTTGATRELVQQIKPSEECQTRSEQKKPDLYLEDLNFDGYPDLSYAVENMSANGSQLVYLYDAAQGLFIENQELEAIPYPTLDLQHSQLVGYTRDGCCWHETANYIFQNGHYFKVYSEIDEVEKKTIKRWEIKDGVAIEQK